MWRGRFQENQDVPFPCGQLSQALTGSAHTRPQARPPEWWPVSSDALPP